MHSWAPDDEGSDEDVVPLVDATTSHRAHAHQAGRAHLRLKGNPISV